MRIVVLGAGELGCTIAELLANEGHDVVVADSMKCGWNVFVDHWMF